MCYHKVMIVLVIMDGVGLRKNKEFNAVKLANTPNLKKLRWQFPNVSLEASGEAVGLPKGVMGNSEAGHLTLGCGRPIKQPLEIINDAIADGSFNQNEALLGAVSHVKELGSALHIVSMLSTGGVHSSFEQTKATINFAIAQGVKNVYLHCILDGRDCEVNAGLDALKELSATYENSPCKISSIIGRAYAMDREQNWERTELAYNLFVRGKGKRTENPIAALQASYARGVYDEFIEPIKVAGGMAIKSGDSVIFTNLRKDRSRQLVAPFVFDDFDKFQTATLYDLYIATFVEYDDDFAPYVNTAFSAEVPEHTLGSIVSHYGRTQIRITETTKFPHVTYYFNGGIDEPHFGESHVMIPTIQEMNFANCPKMRAGEITLKTIDAIKANVYDLIVVNLSNCDMVGHTADLNATISAVEMVDKCVGVIAEATLLAGGECIITADHGNAEELMENGKPKTAHTTNPVPLILVSKKRRKLKKDMTIASVAPTILEMLGLPVPAEMADSLLK